MLSVREHVAIQVVVTLEGLAARGTCELAFIAVSDHVLGKCTLVGEFFVTFVTNERTLLGLFASSCTGRFDRRLRWW